MDAQTGLRPERGTIDGICPPSDNYHFDGKGEQLGGRRAEQHARTANGFQSTIDPLNDHGNDRSLARCGITHCGSDRHDRLSNCATLRPFRAFSPVTLFFFSDCGQDGLEQHTQNYESPCQGRLENPLRRPGHGRQGTERSRQARTVH